MTRGRPPTGSKIGQGGIIQRMLKNSYFLRIFTFELFFIIISQISWIDQ